MPMKKLIYTAALGLFAFATNAQINWQKGGNNATPPGQPATIGTNATWNSPLGFVTNGIQRLQMNGTISTVVNSGLNLPRDGFIGIGNPTGFYNGNGSGQGPYSLLHLNVINLTIL